MRNPEVFEALSTQRSDARRRIIAASGIGSEVTTEAGPKEIEDQCSSRRSHG
jgi:hypothetical protein